MAVVKRIIEDNLERMKVDELLADEYDQAGYGGITLTKTPLGAQINLFTMRPGRVIGKRGRAIKEASERLENELGLENPQITVVEVEVPELNPRIMASRIANALERGVHFRRAIFWSLRRIMDSGAIGCEVLLKGPLRSARTRYEKVVEGYVPKSGDPTIKNVKKSTVHVKMKRGVLGVTVTIVPPDAKFPDKIDIKDLPEISYPESITATVVEESAALPETTEIDLTEPTISVEEKQQEIIQEETPEKIPDEMEIQEPEEKIEPRAQTLHKKEKNSTKTAHSLDEIQKESKREDKEALQENSETQEEGKG
jgi:small subunit ribosomal protein S3